MELAEGEDAFPDTDQAAIAAMGRSGVQAA